MAAILPEVLRNAQARDEIAPIACGFAKTEVSGGRAKSLGVKGMPAMTSSEAF